MALYKAVSDNITPVAVADTTNFTNAGYVAILGGTSYQVIEYLEMQIIGLATASNVQRMIHARDSTVGASSLSGGGNLNPADPYDTAPSTAPTLFNSSTTKPQRGTGYMLGAAFNAFGGVFGWAQQYGFGIKQTGNNAWTGAGTGGEMSLSSISGVQPFTATIGLDVK